MGLAPLLELEAVLDLEGAGGLLLVLCVDLVKAVSDSDPASKTAPECLDVAAAPPYCLGGCLAALSELRTKLCLSLVVAALPPCQWHNL